MSPELATLLHTLIEQWENEVIEFKQAHKNYDTDKIGQYFSALSNEANLRDTECAWLVFGVDNKTRTVTGTDYRLDKEHLHSLKMQIRQGAQPGIGLRNIHELHHPQGRVVLFEIPAAPQGIPIAWQGHYYARAGESLTALGVEKQDHIRQQSLATDWTAQIVPDATLADLDDAAVHKAREFFAQKHANRFKKDEIEQWPLATLLDRAHITRNGQITRTALLLLGKAESVWHLSPHPAQITWSLQGSERAYEHFGPPFLLTTTQLYQRIRNIQLRVLPQDELVPLEVAKYDQKIVLEALHNCIAHQDYTRYGRIVVTEKIDHLLFENEGSFFEGTPEEYVTNQKTPRRYRNPALVQAMVELNMIDRMGYGIHSLYVGQAKRYFPLPDYDINDPDAVSLILHGAFLDEAYSRLLIQKTDLSLQDILALDSVQKKRPIPDKTAARLRRNALIEGRKPRYQVAAHIAQMTGYQTEHIRTRAQDDTFYAKLITDYLEKFGQASRADINAVLAGKLGEMLSDEQKYNRISYLIRKLRATGTIVNSGSDTAPCWRLVPSQAQEKPEITREKREKK